MSTDPLTSPLSEAQGYEPRPSAWRCAVGGNMLRPVVARYRGRVTRYIRAVLRAARATLRPVLRVARATLRPVLRVARATLRPVLRVARATLRPVLREARAAFRSVLRAVRAVLRAVVFLVAIVFLPFCFDVGHSGCGERAGLAAVYGPALTGWAEGLPRTPSLTGVAGAGSEAPATKVVVNVSLTSPLSPGGGNALG